tara:strand:- start:354 stop:710 length:357 start_codon:yes stop_codon:yes gene_type:complete
LKADSSLATFFNSGVSVITGRNAFFVHAENNKCLFHGTTIDFSPHPLDPGLGVSDTGRNQFRISSPAGKESWLDGLTLSGSSRSPSHSQGISLLSIKDNTAHQLVRMICAELTFFLRL